MASFTMQKNDKFSIQKSISKVLVGLGWDVGGTKPIDVDGHVFGCVTTSAGPKFFNDGSHAVTYANGDLKKGPGKAFGSHDGSIISTGDCRTGESSAGGDDEAISIDFTKLPKEINELIVFVTIHEAVKNGLSFSNIQSCYIRGVNEETGEELFRYSLNQEFQGCISVQIGSFVNEGQWTFKASGAGLADKDLGDIIGILS